MKRVHYGWVAIAASAPGFILPFALAGYLSSAAADSYFLLVSICMLATTVATVVGEGLGARLAGSWHEARRVPRLSLATPFCVASLVVTPALLLALIQVNDHLRAPQPLDTLLILAVLPSIAALGSVAAGTHYASGSPTVALASSAFRGSFGLLAVTVAVGVDANEPQTLVTLGMLVGETFRAMTCSAWQGTLTPSGRPRNQRRFLLDTLPHVAAMGTVNLNPVIVRSFAALSPVGAVLAIELADKVLFAAVTVSSAMLLAPATRSWIRELQTENLSSDNLLRSWRVELRRAVLTGFVGVLVCALGTLWPGRTILEAAGLTDDRIWICALVLLIGLPANNVVMLGARLLSLIGATKIMPIFALLNIAVLSSAAWILHSAIGLIGVAASATLMRYIAAFIYVAMMSSLVKKQLPTGAPAHAGNV